jgi:hypothetical protein
VQKQAEQTQPVQKQAEQTQPVQKQAEQTQPVQKQAEQTQPVQSPVRDGKQNNVVYSKPTLITTESGEQYEAQEGDSFEGEIKNGKVVQGRLYDKNGKVKKLFLIKKVH